MKLIAHNLSVPYTSGSAGLFDFDQNGIHFAEDNDLVVTRKKIPEVYLNFLISCGYGLEKTTFIFSESLTPHTYDALFKDGSIIEKCRTALVGKSVSFDSFMVTENEVAWIKRIGLSTPIDKNQYNKFFTKSSFRKLARANLFKIPKGYEEQKGLIDISFSTMKLFLSGVSEVVIKSDEGVSGLSSRRFKAEGFFQNLHTLRDWLESEGAVSLSADSKYVVEDWCRSTRSPSAQLYVSEAGEVEVISAHIQLFNPDNVLQYRGCLSSNYLSPEEKDLIEIESVRFGKVYSELGYRGHLAFNMIVLENGEVLFVETNPRRVMSSYAYQICRKLFCEEASSVYYKSIRIKKSRWKGKDIALILSELKPVLFSAPKKTGVVPFDYQNLLALGSLSIVGFGQTKEDVDHLFEYVDRI